MATRAAKADANTLEKDQVEKEKQERLDLIFARLEQIKALTKKQNKSIQEIEQILDLLLGYLGIAI